MPHTTKLLLSAALLAGCAAHARARSFVRAPTVARQQGEVKKLAVKDGRPVAQFVMLEYNFNTY